MVISKDTLGCHSISLVEIRDAAKYTVQKTAPHQKKKKNNHSVQNVNSAKAEKHSCKTVNYKLPRRMLKHGTIRGVRLTMSLPEAPTIPLSLKSG